MGDFLLKLLTQNQRFQGFAIGAILVLVIFLLLGDREVDIWGLRIERPAITKDSLIEHCVVSPQGDLECHAGAQGTAIQDVAVAYPKLKAEVASLEGKLVIAQNADKCLGRNNDVETNLSDQDMKNYMEKLKFCEDNLESNKIALNSVRDRLKKSEEEIKNLQSEKTVIEKEKSNIFETLKAKDDKLTHCLKQNDVKNSNLSNCNGNRNNLVDCIDFTDEYPSDVSMKEGDIVLTKNGNNFLEIKNIYFYGVVLIASRFDSAKKVDKEIRNGDRFLIVNNKCEYFFTLSSARDGIVTFRISLQ